MPILYPKFSDVHDTYNQLKFHKNRVEPDEEFLALYEDLCKRDKKQRRISSREESSKESLSEFNKKAKSLRRPKPTKRDLVGWLELVYDSLPDGEFTNQDIYAYEPEFKKYYPENRNIKDKIRQQLQELAEYGFVKHISTGRWQKL